MKMTFWELLIKGVPEGFLDVLGVYLISKTKIQLNKYLITSCIFIVFTFILKNLLSQGVSTMVSLLGLVVILVLYNHIEITNSIKSTLIVAIVLIFCETINMLILYFMYGDTFNKFVGFNKAISSIPSTIIFSIVASIYYFVSKNHKGKSAINEEIGSDNSK
jgi:hypothetical protein